MISFSDDNDNLPDSSGEYTGASLTKLDMPKDFTICAAYMVEAWTTDFKMANLFELINKDGRPWTFFNMYAGDTYTEFKARVGPAGFIAYSELVLLPLTCTRFCLSLDTVTWNIRLVVNG